MIWVSMRRLAFCSPDAHAHVRTRLQRRGGQLSEPNARRWIRLLMRSTRSGMVSGLSSFVTRGIESRIADFAAPSFHDGSAPRIMAGFRLHLFAATKNKSDPAKYLFKGCAARCRRPRL